MKLQILKITVWVFMLMGFSISFSYAHFGMMLPSDDMISASDGKQVVLDICFTHPFEGQLMNMEKPLAFGVMDSGAKKDLLKTLKAAKTDGFQTWQSSYKIRRPGDKIFFVEPSPYWEPSEETFIIHYTKLVVAVMGLENQWDREVGLKTELVPLTRPYGLWAGNVFQAVVKVDGKPVPFAEVEVEYLNKDKHITAPDDAYITQTLKADSRGVFTYAMPVAGWWGFAALSTADYKMERNGKKYPVELGAVLWVETREMK